MTRLELKLHQPQAQGHLEAAAIATVRLLADVNGKVVKEWWQREQPITIAGEDGTAGAFTAFDLPSGGYFGVEITRPRGPDLSEEFLVQDGETRTETIQMQVSPHEYLGWQQYAGTVRADPYRREVDRAPSRSMSSSMGIRLDSLAAKGLSRLQALYDQPKDLPAVFAANLPAAGEAWSKVEQAAAGGDRAWAHDVRLPDWSPSASDDEYAAWFLRPMPAPGEGIELIEGLRGNPLSSSLATKFPRWMSFEANSQVDLASVPWAWWGARRDTNEEIRFLYDRIRPSSAGQETSGHLTLSVQDQRWFGLLEFLASGRLSRAGGMFDKVLASENLEEIPETAVYGKVKGPLVATAGAIILIARAESSEPQRWDPWLENLANWFPGISDGAILLGCRQVEQARDVDTLNKAYQRLREGVDRGIPFFSATIRMLTVALAQVGGDIPEADEVRRTIAPVAARVDSDQPFTVIRL